MSALRESVTDRSTTELGLLSIISRVFSRPANPRRHNRRQRREVSTAPNADQSNDSGSGFLKSPKKRLLAGIPAGILVVAGVVAGISALKGTEPVTYNNAIWLDRSWTQGVVDENRIGEFTARLQDNQIGKLYAYTSTLDIERRWTGGPQGKSGFMESQTDISNFVQTVKSKHPAAELYAWLEIWTHLDPIDGYRLDDLGLHANVADFSRLLINDLGFDGILLDVKPLFDENDDFIRLIRTVRSAVGLEVPIAVSVPGDLTPTELDLISLPSIVPGTMWSATFKQRVMVSADEVILLMYQSYRQDTFEYVNWIAYHVETYVNLLETDTKILVSIPNYGGSSAAHNPSVETMAAALDGVDLGLSKLEEDQQELITGIAIYTDEDLDQSEWNVFREKWLQR